VTRPLRILAIDDHRLFTEALEALLKFDETIERVDSVETGEQALEWCRTSRPDLVLMDIDLPGMDGIEATRRLRSIYPEVNVVIISAFQQPDVIRRAMEAGAAGFIPKTRAADELARVLQRASIGETSLPSTDLKSVLAALESARRAHNARAEHADITGREIQILQAIADGKSTAAIAGELYLSPATVQSHVKRILSKLQVHSKLDAVTMALRQGLIRLNPSPD